MQLPFPAPVRSLSPTALSAPRAYRGLYAFHKYWGKKPSEPNQYLIQHLCPERGLVVDPFLGSGVSAFEAVQLNRRVIGIDINPIAIKIARLLVSPPTTGSLVQAFQQVGTLVKNTILESYFTSEGKVATHYVWQNGRMQKVWLRNGSSRNRVELQPTDHDIALSARFESYQPRLLGSPRFFTNSRINTSPSLTLKDLFTGRALHNIELLLDAIAELPMADQEPLKICLTAAVGQMSKMVFAITNRGKTIGKRNDYMEVGSWVIGYWRPAQHFEVNVWNSFERKVRRLIKAISKLELAHITTRSGDVSAVCSGEADCSLIIGDCLQLLPQLPDNLVNLIITDPPHSDRIPYLELSEIWNVILGEQPPFESEIVVSNAKERSKNERAYNQAMLRFLEIVSHKLRKDGYLVLFFNARTRSSWHFFESYLKDEGNVGMVYRGCFPLVYSALSVVQDNRKGALRTDYGLVFSRSVASDRCLAEIPGWSSKIPESLK